MTVPLPAFDQRRRSQLLRELEALAALYLPGWHGPDDQTGRALLQLAAHLAEQVTSRLDRAPARDGLAFFDWLDLPAPAPEAARLPLVFTLSDKLDEAVTVHEPVQVAADVGADEILFETEDALTLTPARLTDLFAVDPANDRIEPAPPHFVDLTAPRETPPSYELASFANTGSVAVQITPTVGLEKGDWITIDGAIYAIDDIKDGIFTLDPHLEAAAPAGAPVGRVTGFAMFSMRNRQSHTFYVAHKELLFLDKPGLIELVVKPAAIAASLAGADIAFELWGKRDGDDAADWQTLTVLGVAGDALRLRKGWNGSVEEREIKDRNGEIKGRKSRWLRGRLLAPLTPDGGPDTRIESLDLRVSSRDSAPARAGQEGSDATIKQAFHNSTPLVLSTRFHPFGPEPRLSDQLYLAAPETFSKKEAVVTLELTMSDVTIGAMTVSGDDGAGFLVAGIGTNGSLQLLRPQAGGGLSWQQFDPPQPSDLPADDRTATAADLELDSGHQPAILQLSVGDASPIRRLVLARDRSERLWSTVMTAEKSGDKAPTSGPWQALAAQVDRGESRDLVALPAVNDPAATARGYAVIATSSGIERLALDDQGVKAGDWVRLRDTGAAPQWNGLVRLAAVHVQPGEVAADELVIVDGAGRLWRGAIAGDSISWIALSDAAAASSAVRPAAARVAADSLIAFIATRDLDRLQAHTRSGDGAIETVQSDPIGITDGAAIVCLPRDPGADPRQPLSAVAVEESGRPAIALWTPPDRARVVPVPTPTSSPRAVAIAMAPSSTDQPGGPLLLAAGAGETVHRNALVEPMAQGNLRRLADVVVLEGMRNTAHFVELHERADVVTLQDAVFHLPEQHDVPGRRFYEIGPAHTLAPHEAYHFYRRRHTANVTFEGYPTDEDGNGLVLDDRDRHTRAGDVLIISKAAYAVSRVDDQHVAVLASPLPEGSDPVSYVVTRKYGRDRVVQATDIAILAELSDFEIGELPAEATDIAILAELSDLEIGELPAEAAGTTLHVPAPADPKVQPIIAHRQLNGRHLVLLGKAWRTEPGTPAAVSLTQPVVVGPWSADSFIRGYQNPELAWEYFDGNGWRRLDDGFVDQTDNLTSSGAIRFNVPETIATTEVAGQESYWIRARLIGGDYGRERFIITTEPRNGSNTTVQTIVRDTSQLHPPEILRIAASFELSEGRPAEGVVTESNLALLDQTEASRTRGAQLDLFVPAAGIDETSTAPALYLALSKPFTAATLRLLVDAEEQDATVDLDWRAFVAGTWRELPLHDRDETHGLMRSGIVSLNAALEPTPHALFGREAFWLRASPAAGAARWTPRLKGVDVNAARAVQAKTVRQEVIGSSLGAPDSRFFLGEPPIIASSAEIRGREVLGIEEKEALIRVEGAEAVAVYPEIEGEWVRWRPVESFVDADGDARVYRLDPVTGGIGFGNGRQGKIPPAGRDNLRAVVYRSGGGARGNVPAFTATSLKAPPTGVEAVTNPLPGTGGVDALQADAIVERAPDRVRHWGQALALADIEALALDYSRKIVRARCLRPGRPGERLRIVLAVAGPEREPRPSLELRDGLKAFLMQRAVSDLGTDTIVVEPPVYVRLKVELEVLARADAPADLQVGVQRRLAEFLHPTTGGPDGTGWPFGRGLWSSDIHRMLIRIDGIDRVLDLTIAPAGGAGDVQRIGPTSLITTAPDAIAIKIRPAAAEVRR